MYIATLVVIIFLETFSFTKGLSTAEGGRGYATLTRLNSRKVQIVTKNST